MLKGYTTPRSPLGLASIDPPPPWHYSSDVIAVEYWTDPKVTAATLPPGLSPDPTTNGHAWMMFLDWQFTAQNEEYLDPARYQYREAFVLLDAMWGKTPLTYCPYIYVDSDAAFERGRIQGFPKRIGSIFQTRSYAAPSLAQGKVAAGGRFGASLSSVGQRLAEARITLRKPVPDPTTVFNRPTSLVRHFPSLVKGQWDKPAVHELALSLTDDLALVDLWTGDAELTMPEARGEELHTLAPMRVGAGYRYGMAYSVTDLRILQDYTK
jgi:acetoacetate decarboxylase